MMHCYDTGFIESLSLSLSLDLPTSLPPLSGCNVYLYLIFRFVGFFFRLQLIISGWEMPLYRNTDVFHFVLLKILFCLSVFKIRMLISIKKWTWVDRTTKKKCCVHVQKRLRHFFPTPKYTIWKSLGMPLKIDMLAFIAFIPNALHLHMFINS